MTNKTFDTVLQAICDLINKDSSGYIYTLHISKNKIFKNIPKQELIDSLRRLEMLRVIYEPAEPEYDAWREDKGSFIPDNADSVCFYAGQECDFESWCQNYKRQNKIKLSALSQETMQDAQRALDEIDEKIKLNGIEELIKINRLHKDARQSILSLLFNKHAIYAFKGSFVLMKQDYSENFRNFKKEVGRILLPLSPRDLKTPTKNTEAILSEQSQAEKPVYRLELNEMSGDLTLNGKQIHHVYFDKLNEKFTKFVMQNPNRNITKDELLKASGTSQIDFHKIIDNLGFRGSLKKVFFRASKHSLLFRNPIYPSQLKKLGIPKNSLSF